MASGTSASGYVLSMTGVSKRLGWRSYPNHPSISVAGVSP
jgi:hypothetical protein